MKITNEIKTACVAIVSIFETSRPFGDFAAYAVLDDGAGVSYGISQFTHRSGSLAAVIDEYLAAGGAIGRKVFVEAGPLLARRDSAAIKSLAGDKTFAKALKAAAISHEMRAAQSSVAYRLYFAPAVKQCEAIGLQFPLSLAVVYDSVVHGSWPRLRDLVNVPPPSKGGNEKAWVTAYVRKRHAWLTASPRLAKTAYRTRFFLDQIAQGRWELELPLRVNGVLLTRSLLNFPAAGTPSAAEPAVNSSEILPDIAPANIEITSEASTREGRTADSHQNTQPPNYPSELATTLATVEDSLYRAARRYDRVEAVVKTVITRKDAAKSLWTTVIGSVWQLAWAVAGFVYGIPRPIWLAAAVIMGTLAALYLYRQITLAKIRESTNSKI
ncbi:MAG: chitosanase [Acidobacteriota bacterium]